MATSMSTARKGRTSVAGTKKRKYKKVSCHTTKTAAKAAQKKLASKGMTATLRGNCVYSAGKKKK